MCPRLLRAGLWVVPVLICGSFTSVIAQNKTDYSPRQLQSHFRAIAMSYSFDGSLELVESPILHWSNPVRKEEQGGLFVWTIDGRPAVLGSFFTYVTQRMHLKHELLSLVNEPLTVSIAGKVAWEPGAAKLSWIDMPITPVVESSSRRLAQIRQIARRFAGEKTELDGETIRLRLLPQPLYRYESPPAGIVDGAILSFVEGTDPEIFLLVEAYRDGDHELRWRYAAARSHWVSLRLTLDGQQIWSQPQDLTIRGRKENERPWSQQPYFSFFPLAGLPSPDALPKGSGD